MAHHNDVDRLTEFSKLEDIAEEGGSSSSIAGFFGRFFRSKSPPEDDALSISSQGSIGRRSMDPDIPPSSSFTLLRPVSRTRGLSTVTQRLSSVIMGRNEEVELEDGQRVDRITGKVLVDYNNSDVRQYWMPDNRSKECYECQEKFTTLRRRHHCRVCGQIFCSRCCNREIPGRLLGYMGNLRLCNYCCENVTLFLDKEAGIKSTEQAAAPLPLNPMSGTEETDSAITDDNTNISMISSSLGPWQGMTSRKTDPVLRASKNGPTTLSVTELPLSALLENEADEEREESSSLEEYEPDWVRSINQQPQMDHSFDDAVHSIWDPKKRRSMDESASTRTTPGSLTRRESEIELPTTIPEVEVTQSHSVPLFPILEQIPPVKEADLPDNSTTPQLQASRNDLSLHLSLHEAFETHSLKLLRYLLRREGLEAAVWLPVLWPTMRDIANTLGPNTKDQKDDLDILTYFHVKKLWTNEAPRAEIISGTACSKAVADLRMRREFESPAILLLSGSLEYERVAGKFSSIDPIILQETDYLKHSVHRILTQRPNVVIVEKSVGRIAQKLLRLEGVTLVYNVKPSVMKRIARCSEAEITNSIEGHVIKPKLGSCLRFHNSTVTEMDGNNKELLIFEGCNPRLESTVLLRGPDRSELKHAKRVLRFMVSTLYSAKLELKMLELTRVCLVDPSSVPNDSGNACAICAANFRQPTPENLVSGLEGELDAVTLTASPFLSFGLPFLAEGRGKECSHLEYFKKSIYPFKPISDFTEPTNSTPADSSVEWSIGAAAKVRAKGKEFITHPFHSAHIREEASAETFRRGLANFRAFGGVEFRRKFSEQKSSRPLPPSPETKIGQMSLKRKLRHHSGPLDVLCPLNHARIAVLFCSYSAKSENAPGFCIDPWVVWMEFYGRHDLPLGDFLQRYCFNPSYMCPKREGKHCEISMLEHTRKIVHRNASVEITSQSIMEERNVRPLAGETNEILTWSWCGKCQSTTQSALMTNDMWHLSFAKYLDYLFNGASLPSHISGGGPERVCSHCSFHQHDHFFSLNNYVSSFKVRLIKLLEVAFSPTICKITPFQTPVLDLVEESKMISEKAGSVFSAMLEQTCQLKNHPDIHKYPGLLKDLIAVNEQAQDAFRDRLNGIQTTLTSMSPLSTRMLSSNELVHYQVKDALVRCRHILSASVHRWNSTVTEFQNALKRRPTASGNNNNSQSTLGELDRNKSNASMDMLEDKANSSVPSISAMVTEEQQNGGEKPAEEAQHVKKQGITSAALAMFHHEEGAKKHPPISVWSLQSPFPDSEHFHLPLGKPPVVVRDEEIGSILAYTLSGEDYAEQLRQIQAEARPDDGPDESLRPQQHIEVQFADAACKYYCKIFYPQEFAKVRELLFGGGEDGFVRSLSRSERWSPIGGKSGAFFFRTKDRRFIMKTLSRFEMSSFLKFGPYYFRYITTAATERKLTALAKIYGVYRVCFKNAQTGEAEKKDVFVMEHLFYGKKVSQVYDLKGSLRNRLASSASEEKRGTSAQGDCVELDLNLLKKAWTSPHYMYPHSKTVLTMAIQNDSHFLSNHHVMDYSLLVGLEEESNQIVVGIIDYIRTYTLDKKLEYWVKSVAVPGQLPTVISPEMYRVRFTEAIDTYFPVAPDQWAGLGQGMLN